MSCFLYTAKSIFAFCILVFLLNGCIESRLPESLARAIMNQSDPETVRDGAPAYLLLVDGLIEDNPENADMLIAGANLYGVYSTIFVEDSARAKRLAARAKIYGERALCSDTPFACELSKKPFDAFNALLQQFDEDDVPALYSFTVSWLAWIKANSDNWTAMADIPKVEAALERIIELDETYELGATHLYLGILSTLRPAALGGKTEKARCHFERAIELSNGKNLSAKVEFARSYARLIYDRQLHDKLLTEVLEADARVPGFTLLNILAKRQAKKLIDSGDDYF